MKKHFLYFVVTVVLASCGSQYNKVKKDPNLGSSYVYGEIDGPARQLKNSYPNSTQESIEKANTFRTVVEEKVAANYQ